MRAPFVTVGSLGSNARGAFLHRVGESGARRQEAKATLPTVLHESAECTDGKKQQKGEGQNVEPCRPHEVVAPELIGDRCKERLDQAIAEEGAVVTTGILSVPNDDATGEGEAISRETPATATEAMASQVVEIRTSVVSNDVRTRVDRVSHLNTSRTVDHEKVKAATFNCAETLSTEDPATTMLSIKVREDGPVLSHPEAERDAGGKAQDLSPSSPLQSHEVPLTPKETLRQEEQRQHREQELAPVARSSNAIVHGDECLSKRSRVRAIIFSRTSTHPARKREKRREREGGPPGPGEYYAFDDMMSRRAMGAAAAIIAPNRSEIN